MSTARHPPAAYASASPRTHPYAGRHHARRPSPRANNDERLPPSPPRSYHDAASPPTAMKDQEAADNYWDDVPPPPASLKSILDSFRRSGEGDRDLLMAILAAKKSEEERLTSIIQTRLTILQARLNMAAIQAQMPPPPVGAEGYPQYSGPAASETVRQERTPSFSTSASSRAPSPTTPHYYSGQTYSHGPERIHLPPPAMYERERERDQRLPPMREREPRDDRDRMPASPRGSGGLDMLLEGVREAERKERA